MPGQLRDERVSVRFPAELLARARELAQSDSRSLSNFIVLAVSDAVRQREEPRTDCGARVVSRDRSFACALPPHHVGDHAPRAKQKLRGGRS